MEVENDVEEVEGFVEDEGVFGEEISEVKEVFRTGNSIAASASSSESLNKSITGILFSDDILPSNTCPSRTCPVGERERKSFLEQ